MQLLGIIMQYSKKILSNSICLLTTISLLAACGGRTANPVMATQYGDANKNCKALEYDISSTEQEMNRIVGSTDKTGQNVALGVAGAFLLVPWFFMDFKNAEATEYQALRQRYSNLTSLAMDKGCDIRVKQYPEIKQAPAQQTTPSTRGGIQR